MFILNYYKSKNILGYSRFLVRVLLPTVARLLIIYLAYIRPFRDWLFTQATGQYLPFSYIWTKEGRLWTDKELSTAFERSTQAIIRIRLNFQS